jgi:hypothetical protein
VTRIGRSRKGEFVLRYEIDTRERPLYLAQSGPRATTEAERERFDEMQARGYTRSRVGAMPGEPEPVSSAELERQTTDAHRRWAEEQAAQRAEELARKDVRRVAAELRQVVIAVVRSGADAMPLLASLERQIKQRADELDGGT